MRAAPEENTIKRFYREVSRIYAETSKTLPSPPENVCGDCRSCCRAATMSHKVSRLEFDTLEFQIGKEKTDRFRTYIKREKDASGQFIFPECPNLDERGCGIHEHRPLSCRLYGHFRTEATPLIDHCVFKGTETILSSEEEREGLPGNAMIRELDLEYASFYGQAEATLPQAAQPKITDEFDLALKLIAVQRHEDAILVLENLMTQNPATFVKQTLAATYNDLGLHNKAVIMLVQALETETNSPQLYYELGRALFSLKRYEEARMGFTESVRLAPTLSMAQGLLGLSYSADGLVKEGLEHLLVAYSLEKKAGPFRFHIGRLYEQLGKLEEAKEFYRSATEHGASRGIALAQLERLEKS